MNRIPIFTLALLTLGVPLSAAAGDIELGIGASVKNLVDVGIAPGKSRLSIVAEGAGKIVAQGATVRFHALCTIVDELSAKEVTAGVGDCAFKATDGGTLHARFETLPGHGDLGHLSFSGGSKSLAGIAGRVPVAVTVNPQKVGKPVFFVESRAEAAGAN